MLQIKFIISGVSNWVKEDLKLPDLEDELIRITEICFKIPVLNDVAITILCAEHTRNERPVQVEVGYTCGTDEYNVGEVFDPDEEQKNLLAKRLKGVIEGHLEAMSGEGERYTPPKASIWIKPERESVFKE